MPKRILVVDDDAILTSLLETKLEKLGYTVIVAKDGEEALRKTRYWKPDLLVLDVCMPKVDGDEVYMTLRSSEDTKDLPILMLTSLVTEEEIITNKRENIFAKPVNFEVFFAKIKQVLGE